MKDTGIVFMGTPEIAVESLRGIVKHNYNVKAVVTSPDKPAGRGLHLSMSAVKQFAIQNNLPLLQPENLSDPQFIETLKKINPDIIIVVAFRKIPDEIIDIPHLGAFNLHASLLPQYRGAAPINWAIINGETQTGITTFLLSNKIDSGNILMQCNLDIPEIWNASMLHDHMKMAGASMIIETIELLIHGHFKPIDQQKLILNPSELKKAPKIFKNDCRINWDSSVKDIQNLIRGLSYKPGAFTELISPQGSIFTLKILFSDYKEIIESSEIGRIETDNKTFLHLYGKNGFIDLKKVQIAGKKPLIVHEFLKGFKLNNLWQLR